MNKERTRRSVLMLMGTLRAAAQSQPKRTSVTRQSAGWRPQSGPNDGRWGADLYDLFLMGGDSIITEEEHFGIINGHMSAGVNYRDVATLNGLYAPPYASSDFLIELRLFGEKVQTKKYDWRPIEVRRQGAVRGVTVSTSTLLLSGMRACLLGVTLHNAAAKTQSIPIQLNITGDSNQKDARPGFDYVKYWGFPRPDTKKAKTSIIVESQRIVLHNTAGAVVIASSFNNLAWAPTSDWSSHWNTTTILRPGERKTYYIAIALGRKEDCESICDQALRDPISMAERSRDEYVRRTGVLLSSMPVFEASNASLSGYYTRSLQHLLLNRWDVSEFVVNPYYSTGSIKGGCVGCYLWDYAILPELMPLYDPVATREHIKQFLRVDITKHYLFNPIDGQGGGPTYLVNQEKIIACIYYYVLHTGDVRFLDEQIDGKSVLEWVFFHALFGDDLSQPAILVDYGEDVSHLELRHRYKYNHVLPDVNAGRYISYLRASTLATIAGRKRPDIDARSGPLKKLLKSTLWDSEHQWLGFQSATGLVELRYTNILYTLIGTGVLDPDDEFGMAGHLNDKEFLSDYGIHSISKLDPAYDQADIDHGGGGSYVAFPAVIAEALYKAGLYGFADDILERTLWWGLRMPYWGDSIVANRIEYRKDTHLQCDFGAAAGAQSIIFGMCGIKVNPNGSIIVNPHPPKFSQEIRLKNLQIRGRSLDIESNQRRYEVRFDGHSRSSAIGVPMLIQLRAEAG